MGWVTGVNQVGVGVNMAVNKGGRCGNRGVLGVWTRGRDRCRPGVGVVCGPGAGEAIGLVLTRVGV